jgi:hypothetical protein
VARANSTCRAFTASQSCCGTMRSSGTSFTIQASPPAAARRQRRPVRADRRSRAGRPAAAGVVLRSRTGRGARSPRTAQCPQGRGARSTW